MAELLLGKYANDTFFLLDGTETSLPMPRHLELFGERSGLKLNLE